MAVATVPAVVQFFVLRAGPASLDLPAAVWTLRRHPRHFQHRAAGLPAGRGAAGASARPQFALIGAHQPGERRDDERGRARRALRRAPGGRRARSSSSACCWSHSKGAREWISEFAARPRWLRGIEGSRQGLRGFARARRREPGHHRARDRRRSKRLRPRFASVSTSR